MKKTINPYNFLRTFCFRSPILSISFYKDLIEKSVIEFDNLKDLWDKPIIKEAIFLASRDLYYEIENNIYEKNYEKIDSLKHPFLKYIIRASTRCTPFGLFSGVGVGHITDNDSIELEHLPSFKRYTSFDNDFLTNLTNKLSKEDFIKNHTIYYLNSSLYPYYNQYRYVEYNYEKNRRKYSIEAVYKNDYLNLIIEKSIKGIYYQDLIYLLTSNEIPHQEASDYINALIENQILVNNLEVTITGKNTFERFLKEVTKTKIPNEIIKTLHLSKDSLHQLDNKIGNTISKYKEIENYVKTLNVPYNPNYLFQTDLEIKTKSNQINQKKIYSIKKVIPLLIKLNKYHENINLTRFKNKFIQRYENQEISLNNVLDIESGIGYLQNNAISNTTPFLNDITPKSKKQNKTPFRFNDAEKIIQQKLIQAIEGKKSIIHLEDRDFENIAVSNSHLPDTLSAFIEIVKNDEEELIILNNLSAQAGKLLGRFSNLENIENHLKGIIEIENKIHPNKILAEIVHTPESRVGNILKRTHLRDYEIPYISNSSLPKKNQISLNDLLISVKDDRIILRSKKLGKEIIPKLTNAHNYSVDSLPIYHLLADLEIQNQIDSINFSWPSVLNNHNYFPRVVYKNIILSKARWKITEKMFTDFTTSTNDKIMDILKKWKDKNKIPDYVQVIENDNTLTICLNHFESVQIFKDLLKKKKKLIIEEFLHVNNRFVSRGDNEYFSNECIISFYNQLKLNNKK